jgi:hypothetical protein
LFNRLRRIDMAICKVCGGEATVIGIMGPHVWFDCRQCEAQYYDHPTPTELDELEVWENGKWAMRMESTDDHS